MLFIYLSASFFACKKEETVSIKKECDAGIYSQIIFDAQNRIKSFVYLNKPYSQIDARLIKVEYTYFTDSIVINSDGLISYASLNPNGNISKEYQENNYGHHILNHKYDSLNHLVKIEYETVDTLGVYNSNEFFLWENGNLQKTWTYEEYKDEDYFEYSYEYETPNPYRTLEPILWKRGSVSTNFCSQKTRNNFGYIHSTVFLIRTIDWPCN